MTQDEENQNAGFILQQCQAIAEALRSPGNGDVFVNTDDIDQFQMDMLHLVDCLITYEPATINEVEVKDLWKIALV